MAPNAAKFEALASATDNLDPSLLEAAPKPLVELIRGENWAEVETRVTQSPEEVQRLGKVTLSGHKVQAYPLHYLCSKKDAPTSLVESFIGIWSAATSAPDSVFGSLPIHLACQHDASVTAIKALVEAFPEGTSTPDMDGNLPIHYACYLGKPDVVLYLLDVTSDTALAQINRRNQNLLHLACARYDISVQVVRALIAKNADFCRQRDWQGRCPVHDACMWHASNLVIEALLQEYPDAVRQWDLQGLTPYGICRKRVCLGATDPTIQLLRTYRRKHGSLLLRGMDLARFKAENLNERLHHHHPHEVHGSMAE